VVIVNVSDFSEFNTVTATEVMFKNCTSHAVLAVFVIDLVE